MVAGCGSGGGTASTSSTPPTPTPTPTPAPAATTVHVGAGAANAFSPNTVNISPGDTVTWVWDGGPHTVTSGAPGAPDGTFCSLPAGQTPSASACNSTSYAQNQGASYSYTFPSSGTFPYYCTVHGAMMTGTVVVGSASGGAGGGGGGGAGGGGGGAGGGGSGGGGY
jgi:plastocyanin